MEQPQLTPVCRNNEWGYIDERANLAIQPQYAFAGPFRDGLARVNKGGEQGRSVGEIVGGRWGYIDPAGKTAIAIRFHEAEDFHEGLAAVNHGAKRTYSPHDDDYYMLGGKWGFIDITGKFQIPATFEAAKSFQDGLAVAREENRFGFIDRNGAWVIPPRFGFCVPFSEGLAAAEYNRKYGFIDRAGEWVIKPRFRLAYPFQEGLGAGLIEETYHWQFIDAQGNDVMEAPNGSTHISGFSEGLSMGKIGTTPRMSDGRLYAGYVEGGCGFFDRQGRWAIPPEYHWAAGFEEGRAWVQLDRTHYGYLRPDGSRLPLPPLTEADYRFHNGKAGVRVNGKFRLIDREGQTIWEE